MINWIGEAKYILLVIGGILIVYLLGSEAIDSVNAKRDFDAIELELDKARDSLNTALTTLEEQTARVDTVIEYQDSLIFITEYKIIERERNEDALIDEIRDRSMDGTAVAVSLNEHIFSEFPFDSIPGDTAVGAGN